MAYRNARGCEPAHGTLGTHNAPHLHPITPDLYLLLALPLFIVFHRDAENSSVNLAELKIMAGVVPTKKEEEKNKNSPGKALRQNIILHIYF